MVLYILGILTGFIGGPALGLLILIKSNGHRKLAKRVLDDLEGD